MSSSLRCALVVSTLSLLCRWIERERENLTISPYLPCFGLGQRPLTPIQAIICTVHIILQTVVGYSGLKLFLNTRGNHNNNINLSNTISLILSSLNFNLVFNTFSPTSISSFTEFSNLIDLT